MPDLLLADRSTVPPGATVLLERRFDQSSIGALRGELTRYGTANGLTDVALVHFVLAVNEITTNAVRYAGGRGQLTLLRHDSDLWCVVADRGPGIPQRHLEPSIRRAAGQIGGHGIWLARQICDSVGIETNRKSGTRVVLRYGLPAAEGAARRHPSSTPAPRSSDGDDS